MPDLIPVTIVNPVIDCVPVFDWYASAVGIMAYFDIEKNVLPPSGETALYGL